jgi:hypothetical protein
MAKPRLTFSMLIIWRMPILGFSILFELGGHVLPDGPSMRPEKREAMPSLEAKFIVPILVRKN